MLPYMFKVTGWQLAQIWCCYKVLAVLASCCVALNVNCFAALGGAVTTLQMRRGPSPVLFLCCSFKQVIRASSQSWICDDSECCVADGVQGVSDLQSYDNP